MIVAVIKILMSSVVAAETEQYCNDKSLPQIIWEFFLLLIIDMTNTIHTIFALAIGAHADDIEVGAGGLIAKWVAQQKLVGILDLTQAELSSNGVPESRLTESSQSMKILGAAFRENAQLPDGKVGTTDKELDYLVNLIRKYKPQYILAPYWNDRHPDHVATSALVQRAVFLSGMSKYLPQSQPHKVTQILYYMLHGTFDPSFVVDISSEFSTKKQSIQAYTSQFTHAKSTDITTPLNTGSFTEYITARSKQYGYMIGVEYGEPYIIQHSLLGTPDPSQLRFKQA